VRAITLPLIAACAVLAVGCQESGFDERKETARPLKVQHALGESKVPGQAEQPFTLGLDALDGTLALGVQPVGAGVPGGRLPDYLRDEAAGLEIQDEAAEPPQDADLIVAGAPRGEQEFLDLAAVAPTVVLDEGGATWKLNVRLVGEALGRTNDAEALLSRYDERAAGARESLPADARVAVPGAGRESFAASVLADAGVELVARDRADATLDDPVWTGPGGFLAAEAALADLQRMLRE
jgi:iron complex transport system substrate-binding protein